MLRGMGTPQHPLPSRWEKASARQLTRMAADERSAAAVLRRWADDAERRATQLEELARVRGKGKWWIGTSDADPLGE